MVLPKPQWALGGVSERCLLSNFRFLSDFGHTFVKFNWRNSVVKFDNLYTQKLEIFLQNGI